MDIRSRQKRHFRRPPADYWIQSQHDALTTESMVVQNDTSFITKPMSTWLSLLFFAIPSLVLVVDFHWVMPTLTTRGMTPFYAYFVAGGIPMAGMLMASLVAYWREGNPLTWASVKVRFRLYRINGKSWVWVVGILVLSFLGFDLATQVANELIARGIMPLPAALPAFLDPRSTAPPLLALDEAFGGL